MCAIAVAILAIPVREASIRLGFVAVVVALLVAAVLALPS